MRHLVRAEEPTTTLGPGNVALPMSPAVLGRIQSAIESGSANATDVAAIIKTDPTLVGSVLRLVNSAWFGLPQQIGRPTAAVAYLGLSEIHRLVVTASVINTFKHIQAPELKVSWHHATLTALVARQLTKQRARWLSSSIAWTLGVLHDVGSLVRLTLEPENERKIQAYVAAQEALPEEAEMTLGLPSSTYWGRALCEAWRLPPIFALVAGHHRLGMAPKTASVDDAAYLALVSSASLVARMVTRPLREDVRVAISSRLVALLDCDTRELWDIIGQAHALNAEAERATTDLLR